MAHEALRGYRNAYNRVQELREIAPCVQIRAPVIDAEDAWAARQFLGILDDSSGGETDAWSSSSTGLESQENPVAPKLALAVLVVVGLSQLALWMFMFVAR
jgi:hypothetical protein